MSRNDEAELTETLALDDLRDWTHDETRWAQQGGKVKGSPARLVAIREAACEAICDRTMPLFGRATNYRRAHAASFALGDSHPLLDRLRDFIDTRHGEDQLRAELGDAFVSLLLDARFAVAKSTACARPRRSS